MIQRQRMEPTRLALLALVALALTACANLWNFEDFRPVPTDDASEEPSGGDATVDAGPTLVQDATLESGESATTVPTVDAADAADAQDAQDGDANACATCGGSYCVDFTSDPNHCGKCEVACTGANTKCIASRCDCAPPTHLCGTNCVYDNVLNCGLSCAVCLRPLGSVGYFNCEDGGCAAHCTPGLTLCDQNTAAAACIDTSQDPSHCGDCVTACVVPDGGLSSTCVSSACVLDCKTGLKPCPAAKPTTCVDMANDVHNCNGCGVTCPAHDSGTAASCIGGICH